MLPEPTVEKLRDMDMGGMSEAFLAQERDPDVHGMDFVDRFSLLVDAEWMLRQNKRLRRRLQEAKLKYSAACVEGIEAEPARGLDRTMLKKLSAGTFAADQRNVIIDGAAGTGKTYLACSFAQLACRKGYRALYRRTSNLYHELALARGDGSYAKLLARLRKIDVLVLDDFALTTMSDGDAQALLDVLDDRSEERSTIITSQLATKDWHAYLPEPTVADAICDRVLNGSYRISLKGPSRRNTKEKTSKDQD